MEPGRSRAARDLHAERPARAGLKLARVFVLGNACLDLRLELPRLPRPGETLPGTNPSRAPGGKGLNQAVASARAGAETHFMAPLGDDAQGAEIAAILAEERLAELALPRLAAPTDYSLVMVLPDGENSITGAGSCAAALDPEAAARFAACCAPGDILLMQGNLRRDTTEAALRAARRAGARTLLNPAPLWWDARPLLALCDCIIVNRGEASMVADAVDPHIAVGRLRELGAQRAIVTLGAEGCLLADDDGLRHTPAPQVRAIDTTGCGDAFCGVLVACLAHGHSLAAAIGHAQRAAARTATRPGAYAALPGRAELAEAGALPRTPSRGFAP